MKKFEIPVQIRWSDIDPNFHLRHSVFYDWATMCRLDFLKERGLTAALMKKLHSGPVILREECVFRKEILFDDHVTIHLKMQKSRRDYSRWTIVHEIKKQEDTLCALVTVDGAWLNTTDRKLFVPPAEVMEVFRQVPPAENFQWLD